MNAYLLAWGVLLFLLGMLTERWRHRRHERAIELELRRVRDGLEAAANIVAESAEKQARARKFFPADWRPNVVPLKRGDR